MTQATEQRMRISVGVAVTSLVTGIVGLVLCWVPWVGLALGVIATTFGGVGIYRANRNRADGIGLATAGLVLGILATVGGVASTAVAMTATAAVTSVANAETAAPDYTPPWPTPTPTPTIPGPPTVSDASFGATYGVTRMSLAADGTASAETTATVNAAAPTWSATQPASSGGAGHYIVFHVSIQAKTDQLVVSPADFAANGGNGDVVPLTASWNNDATDGLDDSTLQNGQTTSGIISGDLPGVTHGTLTYTPEDSSATPIAWKF